MIEGEDDTLAQLNQLDAMEVQSEDVHSKLSLSMDSITHPYRSMMSDTSFPRCHLTGTPAGKTETYTRTMLIHGHGLPVWDPLGNVNRPKKHIKSGVSIGDVGVLDKDGDFECFFNIFLPKTDEIQRKCPPDMVPFHPAPCAADIATDASYFPPGTVLVSKRFESKVLSTSPLNIDFKINAREGGILVLPQGASREDLISTTRLREYIHEHALSWYVYMNEKWRGQIFTPNGSLFVVTGCDKAPSWAIAASHPVGYRGSNYPLSVKFREENSPFWETNSGRGIWCKSIKESTDQSRCQQYSVFLRGMKVAVSIPNWTSHILHNEPPLSLRFYNLLAIPITGLGAKYQTFIERLHDFPDQYLSQPTNFVFHPSDVLLRFMLEECPSSQVAIVEDTVLSTNYKAIGDGGGREVAQFLVRVASDYDIQNENGLVTLIPKALVPEESKSSSYLQRSLFFIPSLFKQWHKTRSQHKQLIDKLSKIYPGPPVPEEDLLCGY